MYIYSFSSYILTNKFQAKKYSNLFAKMDNNNNNISQKTVFGIENKLEQQ